MNAITKILGLRHYQATKAVMRINMFAKAVALLVAFASNAAWAGVGNVNYSGFNNGVPFSGGASALSLADAHQIIDPNGVSVEMWGYDTPTIVGSAVQTGVGSGVNVQAMVQYTYTVTGPASLSPIPVLFSGAYSVESNFVGGSLAWVNYNVDGSTPARRTTECEISNTTECGYGYFEGSVEAVANKAYYVYLYLTLGVTGNQVSGGVIQTGTANGFIDPYLYLDPVWAAEHPGYSIVTDGVGNAAPATPGAVPEPSTYALMLVGLGALARTRRRHHLQCV